MARKGRARLRALTHLVETAYPQIDADRAIRSGRVFVNGVAATNPASLVHTHASIALAGRDPVLRGEAKLRAALEAFAVSVEGRVAMDLGASAGGFTRVLLGAGALRVYAVDAGFGQLLGSLRQDQAVINLERTNLADLNESLVPDAIEIVAIDLSYLALALALPQVNERVRLASTCDLVALVKPQFELGLRSPPMHCAALREAVTRAASAAGQAGWDVVHVIESPVTGTRGAIEFLLHGRR
jgi:23S rRNA (cytidine1920-2'-O)/16S rRNA (cytidine1409-2'-O)-methyltransferase